MKKYLLLLTLFIISLNSVAESKALYIFDSPQQEQRFYQLTNQLRCLVCQNQSIAESNAPLAADLRELIASKVKAGETSKEITDYLVQRYGEFILYKPVLNAKTYVLWLSPFILLILVLGILLISSFTERFES